MESFVLNAELRSSEEKLNLLREDRKVPAVVYGKDSEPVAIKIDASELLKTERKAKKNHLIELTIDGKVTKVIIHDYQLEPVSGEFNHVDFRVVTDETIVTAQIPVKLTGTSAALRLGAMLDHSLKSLTVKCLPADLVESFEADLALLAEAGDNISVKDVQVSDKYKVINPANEVVASAVKLRGGK